MKKIACLIIFLFFAGCASGPLKRQGNRTYISGPNVSVSDKTATLAVVGTGAGILIGNHYGNAFSGGITGALMGGILGLILEAFDKNEKNFYQEAYQRETEWLRYQERCRWEQEEAMRGREDARRNFYNR